MATGVHLAADNPTFKVALRLVSPKDLRQGYLAHLVVYQTPRNGVPWAIQSVRLPSDPQQQPYLLCTTRRWVRVSIAQGTGLGKLTPLGNSLEDVYMGRKEQEKIARMRLSITI